MQQTEALLRMLGDLGMGNMSMGDLRMDQKNESPYKSTGHILADAKIEGLKASTEIVARHLAGAIEQLQETVQEKDREIDRTKTALEKHISSMQKKLNEAYKTASKLDNEKSELGNKIHDLRSKVRQLEAELAAAKADKIAPADNTADDIIDLIDEATIPNGKLSDDGSDKEAHHVN